MNETELDNLKEIFKELEDQPTYTFELVNIDRYELVEKKSWKRLEALNKIKELKKTLEKSKSELKSMDWYKKDLEKTIKNAEESLELFRNMKFD